MYSTSIPVSAVNALNNGSHSSGEVPQYTTTFLPEALTWIGAEIEKTNTNDINSIGNTFFHDIFLILCLLLNKL